MKNATGTERLGAYYEDLGAAAMVCARLEPFRSFSLRAISAWIVPAIHHGQIEFFCDKRGWPTGFVTWAHLSPETQSRMASDPAYIPRICEWNEGQKTQIMTIAARDGLLYAIIRHIARSMFLRCEEVGVFSRRISGGRRRLLTRSHRSGCGE